MPSMTYVALTRTGRTISGHLEAETVTTALSRLRAEGLTPLSLRRRLEVLGLSGRIPVAVAANALRSLSHLLKIGGVPLSQALPVLAQEESHLRMQAVLRALTHAVVAESVPLSRAMARTPQVFPEVVVYRVAAGESDGTLDDALMSAAGHLLQAARTRRKLLGALSYPLLLLAITVGVISALSIIVMPQFEAYYRQAGVPLPLLTRLVIGFGRVIAHGWPLLLIAAAGGVALARWALEQPRVRASLDQALWELPGWRRVVRQLAWARFAQVLGLLYRHGADILQCLQLACGAAGTTVIRSKTALVVGRVGQAKPLGDAFREAGVFPERLITIAELGEQYGTLDRMLVDLAGQYTDDVELILEQLPQLIQPVTIVCVGCLVGTFLLALYYPMFHLYSILK